MSCQAMFDLTGSAKMAWSVFRCFLLMTLAIVSLDDTIVKSNKIREIQGSVHLADDPQKR